jgi:branched-subunit amino acid ABC-type transport system permease component
MQMGAALLPLAAPAVLAGTAIGLWWPWALTVPAAAVLATVAYAALAALAVRPDRREPAPWRLRCLAGVLHAVQPFVRAWGRLRGHPLPPGPAVPHPWTGDRTSWLAALHRELARGWRSVTPGGPTDPWDLAVAVGPCVRCRLTTAVVWGWQPRWRTRVVPRPGWLAAMAVGVLLPTVTAWLVAVPLALLGAATGEALVLRGVVRRTVRRTVAGADAPTPGEERG